MVMRNNRRVIPAARNVRASRARTATARFSELNQSEEQRAARCAQEACCLRRARCQLRSGGGGRFNRIRSGVLIVDRTR